MNTQANQSVKLRDLLAQPNRSDLKQLFVVSESSTVREVVLISDIEEITSIGPATIVILSADVARGSWMVSAAIRYAWERNACALIIPDRSLNSSVLRLAERFQISLFTTTAHIPEVAVEVATQLGFARAQLVSSLHRLTRLVDHSEDIGEVLTLASEWLHGTQVSLESSGTVVRSARAEAAEHALVPTRVALPTRVSVPVGVAPASPAMLVVEVAASAREEATAVLRICATKLRALVAEAQLAALQHSLPPVSIATLSEQADRVPRIPATPDWPAWSHDRTFVALCLLSNHRERYGAALHQLWLAEFREFPLVPSAEGWLALVTVGDAGGTAEVIERATSRMAEIHLLDLRVGVSQPHVGPTGIRGAVREAWLAARFAEAGGQNALVDYGQLPTAALPHLLPAPLAEELLGMAYPALAAEPAREELFALYCEYAATLGSATATAATLGIHRNTVKQRLSRLEQLGLPIADPGETLGIYLLLNALRNAPVAPIVAGIPWSKQAEGFQDVIAKYGAE